MVGSANTCGTQSSKMGVVLPVRFDDIIVP
jgi:hypothetical protein